MSLTGNLDVFPLEEVLGLLSRSHQSGCLRVEGPGAGRIYLERGSISYASVEPDEALAAQLLAAGIVTDQTLRQAELSNSSLAEALAPDTSAGALSDVIREQCVEGLYRIRKPATGPFAFSVDSRPRYATGQTFDIEMLVADADRRALEWADIEQAVPDLAVRWHMVPAIDEESVTLADTAWSFIAALGGTSSVEQVAARLGLTSFQAARRMAELSRSQLVEMESTAVAAPALPEALGVGSPEPAGSVAAVVGGLGEISPWLDEVEQPVVQAPVERSWWEAEKADELGTDTPEHVESEKDDESFLESVFGALESDEAAAPEPADDSTEEDPEADDDRQVNDEDQVGENSGSGLLRRRGLGAAVRELADS